MGEYAGADIEQRRLAIGRSIQCVAGRWTPCGSACLLPGAFTVVFLFGQVLAWRQLGAMVHFEMTNPAIAFFYLITGLHGLHLLGRSGGLGQDRRQSVGRFDVAKIRHSVELCTLYWHFLLGVWVVLFGLLFSGIIWTSC